MTQTVAQFAERMLKAPATLKAAERSMVAASALAITTAVRRTLSDATNGSNRLSGVGARGAKLSVGYDIRVASRPTALVRMRGPAQLIERDTKPHTITPKRALALSTPSGAFASVRSPGTRGKRPWEKGVAAGLLTVDRAKTVAARDTLLKVIRG